MKSNIVRTRQERIGYSVYVVETGEVIMETNSLRLALKLAGTINRRPALLSIYVSNSEHLTRDKGHETRNYGGVTIPEHLQKDRVDWDGDGILDYIPHWIKKD